MLSVYLPKPSMMKTLFSKIVLSVFTLLISASSLKSQILIIPEVGMNLSEFSFNLDGYDNSTNVGIQAGALARFGKSAFFQTGVFYSEYSNQIIYKDSTGFTNSDQLKISSILLPLNVGFSLVNTDILKVRLLAGINLAFPIKVDENAFSIEKSDFNSTSVGAAVGFGFDIYRFVFDTNFSFGMNDMLNKDGTTAGLNLYSISIGYLIGDYY